MRNAARSLLAIPTVYAGAAGPQPPRRDGYGEVLLETQSENESKDSFVKKIEYQVYVPKLGAPQSLIPISFSRRVYAM